MCNRNDMFYRFAFIYEKEELSEVAFQIKVGDDDWGLDVACRMKPGEQYTIPVGMLYKIEEAEMYGYEHRPSIIINK